MSLNVEAVPPPRPRESADRSRADVAEQLQPRQRHRRLAGLDPAVDRDPVDGRRAALDQVEHLGQQRLERRWLARPALGPDSEQRVENVTRVADHRRALAQKLVRALRDPSVDVTRDRADGATDLDRLVCGDQRARRLRRLDDHDHLRRARPSAGCARGTDACARRCPADTRRSTAPFAQISRMEAPVDGRVGDVGSVGEHGDRRPAGSQRAAVRGGVDPERHPADNGEARRSPGRTRAARRFAARTRSRGAHRRS